MKFGVVVFPGSNCDEDMVFAFQDTLKQEVVKLWHKDHDLQNVDFVILPGGFSYGDYLRSGAIARYSPLMQEVIAFANKGGYVMGVCNGFQILAEAGLVPGVLLHNNSHKYICSNTYLKAQNNNTLVTKGVLPNQVLKIPIGHGEGRYFASSDTLKEIQDNEQILFKYCDCDGNIVQEANPNGALENIAGVCNKNKNVFGMMPHPERAASHVMGNSDGLVILESLLQMLPA